jgi:hypothetical protein
MNAHTETPWDRVGNRKTQPGYVPNRANTSRTSPASVT